MRSRSRRRRDRVRSRGPRCSRRRGRRCGRCGRWWRRRRCRNRRLGRRGGRRRGWDCGRFGRRRVLLFLLLLLLLFQFLFIVVIRHRRLGEHLRRRGLRGILFWRRDYIPCRRHLYRHDTGQDRAGHEQPINRVHIFSSCWEIANLCEPRSGGACWLMLP